MIDLATMTREAVRANWQIYKGFIAKACEHDLEKRLTLDTVYDSLLTGDYFLIQIKDAGVVVGATVFTVAETDEHRRLFVTTCGGVNSDAWLTRLVEYLDFVASGLKCKDGVLFCGRIGWQKKLKNLGYSTLLVTMHKEAIT
jgi:hypothetical protein